jgi:hypothetical protein
MKNKYKKYTNSYMKYLRFLHTEFTKNLKLKEMLHRGYFGFWDHSDWDYTKTKREGRILAHYYDHMLGLNILKK